METIRPSSISRFQLAIKTSSEVELMETYPLGRLGFQHRSIKTSSEVELMETTTAKRLLMGWQAIKTSSEVELMETRVVLVHQIPISRRSKLLRKLN